LGQLPVPGHELVPAHRWPFGGDLGDDVGDFTPAEAEANYYAALDNLDMVA
jgi:hypothetical protein